MMVDILILFFYVSDSFKKMYTQLLVKNNY